MSQVPTVPMFLWETQMFKTQPYWDKTLLTAFVQKQGRGVCIFNMWNWVAEA